MESISGPGTFLYAIYAETHEAAMQQHYGRQGWAAYKPVPGTTDQLYSAAALKRQLDAYPDDQELRTRNPS